MSFTSSIIDSLRGFDLNGDVASEMSASEDLWHCKEKELESQLLKKDRRIEALETEVIELKNRLQKEFDKRLSAEDELRALRIQFDALLEEVRVNGHHSDSADISFSSNEHLPGVERREEKRGAADDDVREARDLRDASQQHADHHREIEKNNALIHFLEERILGLEEDISKKEDALKSLEVQVMELQVREEKLVNASVSVDEYNQLKASKKHEKEKYQEEIHSLEDQIERLEQEVRDSKKETLILRTEMTSCENESIHSLEQQVESLQQQVESLEDEISALREHMEESVLDHAETVHAYRTNLIALYEKKCDKMVDIALRRIVALRRGDMDVDL